jgi:hypothetical protein
MAGHSEGKGAHPSCYYRPEKDRQYCGAACREWIAKLSLTNIAFHDMEGPRVTATFDKEWDFRGTKGFAGSEKQEMVFVKKEGHWRIASERELRVYWVRRPG